VAARCTGAALSDACDRFLNSASLEPNRKLVEAFVQSLSQNGYVEGKNIAIEYRWANGQYDRLPTCTYGKAPTPSPLDDGSSHQINTRSWMYARTAA
jgi:hypothetical protein